MPLLLLLTPTWKTPSLGTGDQNVSLALCGRATVKKLPETDVESDNNDCQ